MSQNKQDTPKKAVLYRMVNDQHVCPFGIKAKDLLTRKGYKVDDNHLKSRQETDDFKQKYNVETTPQTFIDGKRIGGYDDLLVFFGENKPQKQTTYQPVLAVFTVAFLMALATSYTSAHMLDILFIIKMFMGFSISILAMLKLQDLDSFVTQFITYDLIAMKKVRYAYIYAFAEILIGIGILASVLTVILGVMAVFIGVVGAVLVFYAVYIQKRELKCACVGGNSKVPLGFLSLTENIMMVIMGVWMLFM